MAEAMLRRHAAGFTFLELMFVVGFTALMMAVTVPAISGARFRLEQRAAVREVAAAIQGARLQAVTTAHTLRLRFNCPSQGQYRVVEFLNTAVDAAANRCSQAAYPYPQLNPAVTPALDGPILSIRSGAVFGTVADLQITSDGRIVATTGATPVSLTVRMRNVNQTIVVSSSGRIVVP
jgi:type II secretory pathway pseudopilin PulG